ncbi:RING-H2 finger protein ATL3 [Bienertia sinuspersici]
MEEINMSPPTMDAATSKAISLSAQIMIGAIVMLCFVIGVCLFLHLYVRCFWLHNHEDPNIVSWRRRQARQRRTQSTVAAHGRGLDLAALQSLPLVVYNPKDFKEGLECAVCLSEVSEGEKARLLPKCNHGFHVECIDMWFQSHSTCPLCRNSVISDDNNSDHNNAEVQDDDGSYLSDSSESGNDHDDGSFDSPRATESPAFPTNVLFWGNETQVRSFGQADAAASSSGVSRPGNHDEIVIEIPCHDCLSLPPPQEEPKTPVMTRLRSLRRLLSLGKRVAVAPSPHGSSSCDVDQAQQV